MLASTFALGDALFTKTQRRGLSVLYGKPEQSFYLNEIIRLADIGKGTVVRELEKLCAAGLLTVSKRGNQHHYQANKDSPIFEELKSIIRKTFGLADILKTALQPLLPNVKLAFVYGSVAKNTEHAGSDIDLMLIGDDLSYTDVMELCIPAERQLGRKINPTLYTEKEFYERIAKQQSFISRVLEQDKLWIIGEKIMIQGLANPQLDAVIIRN